MARVTGVNHITLAVGDVGRSVTFYSDVLGFVLRAIWAEGAYLDAGPLWLCLSYDKDVRSLPHPDYSHIAFSVADAEYARLSERLIAQCPLWKENRSQGASVYFLDPDGHKLELHQGTLPSRLQHYRDNPSLGVHVVDTGRLANHGCP